MFPSRLHRYSSKGPHSLPLSRKSSPAISSTANTNSRISSSSSSQGPAGAAETPEPEPEQQSRRKGHSLLLFLPVVSSFFHKVHLKFVKRPERESGRKNLFLFFLADVTGTLYGAVNLGALLAEQPSLPPPHSSSLPDDERPLFPTSPPSIFFHNSSPHMVTFKKAPFHKNDLGKRREEEAY